LSCWRRCGLRVRSDARLSLLHPEENIVLRDGGNQEIGTIRNLKDCPKRHKN
jgi:hypothetical protein